MAKLYTASARGIAAAAGASYASFHTTAAARARIREIGFFLSAATVSSIGLGTPANTPVASTSAVSQKHEQGDVAPTALLDTVWSTAPTTPSNFFRRAALPATAGAGLIWTFPPDAPLILNVSSWFTLWNFGAGAGAAPDIYIVWEE